MRVLLTTWLMGATKVLAETATWLARSSDAQTAVAPPFRPMLAKGGNAPPPREEPQRTDGHLVKPDQLLRPWFSPGTAFQGNQSARQLGDLACQGSFGDTGQSHLSCMQKFLPTISPDTLIKSISETPAGKSCRRFKSLTAPGAFRLLQELEEHGRK
jgi:hypothetical protein